MKLLPLQPGFLLAFATLAFSPPAAAADGDLRPLVEVHDRHVLAAGPANVAFVDQHLLVARDGTAVFTSVNRGLLGNDPFATTIANGQASPASLATLSAALVAARPIQLSGVCHTELFPLGSSFRITMSWFGVTSRQSLFTLSNDGTATQSCSPGVVALFQAVQELQRALLLDPATTLSSPVCQGGSQCPAGLLCCYPCGIAGCQNRCGRPASNGECPAFP
jgi:hypothetical protein